MDVNWTAEREAEAVRILVDKPGTVKNRRYYHVRQHFQVVELGGLRRVCKKNSGKLMTTQESFTSIIQDVHKAIGHKGETKTFYKIQEMYTNITKAAVKGFIANCERCAEKVKKSAWDIVVRPILIIERSQTVTSNG